MFVVRIHRLNEPFVLSLTPEMGGCKSWIDLPQAFTAFPSAPVLDDVAFSKRLAALPLLA